MADSNITKQALANSLKELMQEMSFEKINVVQICERCNMNRKSFYYHFKDKYDLVNWIFDMDFYMIMDASALDRWVFIEKACTYFENNRAFYKSLLNYRGQNNFRDHLRAVMAPLCQARLEKLLGGKKIDFTFINFFTEGILGALEYWISDGDGMSAENFVNSLQFLIHRVEKTYETDPQMFL